MLNYKVEKNSAFLLTDRVDRMYFSGKDIAEGYLVFGEKKAYFSDYRYHLDTQKYFKNTEFQALPFLSIQDIKAFIQSNKIEKLYINFDKVSLSEYERFKTFGVEIKNGVDIINELRSIKSQEEISFIKRACEVAQKAYHKSIRQVRLGMTEIELKDIIEENICKQGCDIGFETIVAFAKGTAVPHHQTGKTRLRENQPILVDMGAKYKGYISDLTRMAFFGKPSEKFLRVYESVLKANQTAEEQICVGMEYRVADSIARCQLSKDNLDKYFTHSLGHGVGLEVHENIVLSPKANGKIQENMVFTVEPGVYLDNQFGVRIEDTVQVKDGKVQRLFTDEKKLIIIKR